MTPAQTIEIEGKRFVLVSEQDYQRLRRQAGDAAMPPLPAANERGDMPAKAFAQASIARDIIRERQALGLSQAQLAHRAGIRQETLSRLESGKHSPTVRTVEKIDKALKQAQRTRKKAG